MLNASISPIRSGDTRKTEPRRSEYPHYRRSGEYVSFGSETRVGYANMNSRPASEEREEFRSFLLNGCNTDREQRLRQRVPLSQAKCH